MLEYKRLQRDRRKFPAFTGLTVKEFKALLPVFSEASRRKDVSHQTRAGKKRKRQVGGGPQGRLPTTAPKKLFILVDLKAYPLQVVIGELFDSSQAAAKQWIHRLLPVLRDALTATGVRPERDGKKLAQAARGRTEATTYIIDGTERRRQRPICPAKQALHGSGKKRIHSDKNLIVVQPQSARVGYLSPTDAGTPPDQNLADQEQRAYPRRAILPKDTGFQGYEPKVKQTQQVKKSRRAKN
jgi:hypothetical protein